MAAFDAGLSAQKTKEADPEHYQGEEPFIYFHEAAQHFKQATEGQIDNQVLSLAYGYLALIHFDGLDGGEKQQDITPNMLHACEAINTLGQSDHGLENIPRDFQNSFLDMIERLYAQRLEYEDRNQWAGRLVQEIREYREKQIPFAGLDSYRLANKYREEKIAAIDTVKLTFNLLKEIHPSAEMNSASSPSINKVC